MRNELQQSRHSLVLLFLQGSPRKKVSRDPLLDEKTEGRLGLIDDNRASSRGGRGGFEWARMEKIGPTSCTRRQEKNSRMDTSPRTKSVERPVRAVDLFIASLDALTLLEGSSTLSAQIDSDERATLLASFGRPVCGTSDEGGAGGEIRGSREKERNVS